MILLRDLYLPLDTDFSRPAALAARALCCDPAEIADARLWRKSVDARRRDRVRFCCTLLLTLSPDAEERLCQTRRDVAPYVSQPYVWPTAAAATRPVVVGFGPAGMFAALALARAGLHPLVLERGRPVEERVRDVERFFSAGALDAESNVQFGEGGAGTFSDGKLHSGIRDPRCRVVLETFARFGAGERVLYEANPHIGTDILRGVVRSIREEVVRLGGEIRFSHRLQDIFVRQGRLVGVEIATPAGSETLDCDRLLLAIGHSARDTVRRLLLRGVEFCAKPFSLGVRIEHLQADIDRARYGAFAGHPALGAADYRLALHLPDGRGVYTFCMCPGGVVVNGASEPGGFVTNGMSYAARDGANANSALLVGVSPEDFPSDDPLSGMEWQRQIERAAFAATAGQGIPAQRVADFLQGRASTAFGRVRPTVRPAAVPAALDAVLPALVTASLRAALPLLDRRLPGFCAPDAVLSAPETRSSAPFRIPRDERYTAAGCFGLFPAGEGAGYAGGILSAAVDGLRCAEALCASYGAAYK